MNPHPPRGVLYLRVSSDPQAEQGYSLPEQEPKGRAYCAQEGIELVELVVDDITGKILSRPGLSRVTELAEARAFDVLVVIKLDRLARQNYLRRHYEEWLEKRGIEVVFVEQHFDRTPSGRLQKGIMGEFAEYESELIRERTMGGRYTKARERSLMPGGYGLFGYHQVTKAEATVIPKYAGRAGELEVVEAEAGIVREMFSRYAGGHTLGEVVRWLHDLGVSPRRSGAWTRETVRKMLTNEAYVGRLYYGMRSATLASPDPTIGGDLSKALTRSGNVRRVRRPRPRCDWIPVTCPAIVAEGTFAAVRARLEQNRGLKGRPSFLWPLRGVVSCGHCKTLSGRPRNCCGKPTRRKGETYRQYSCTTNFMADTSLRCGTWALAGALEKMAEDALRKRAVPALAGAAARRRAERDLAKSDPEEEVAAALGALAELQAEELAVLERSVQFPFSREAVAASLAKIAASRARLEERLAAARKRSGGQRSPDEAEERAVRFAGWLGGALDSAAEDPAQLQVLFRRLVQVTIYRDGRRPRIAVLESDALPD